MKSVITYNPASVLGNVFDDWDRVMADFLGTDLGSTRSASTCGYPAVDIREEKERYVLEADLPGMNEKDIDIKVNDRVLTLSSVKQEEKNEERAGTWLIRERGVKLFRRAFTLPRNVDTEAIKAVFKDGLLTVDIPKRPEAREKSVSVTKG